MFESPNPTSLYQTALNTMRALEMDPDPWQMEVLAGGHDRLLLEPGSVPSPSPPVAPPEPLKRKWLSIHNDALWTRIG
jgi:hypothetical protein